MAKRFFIYTAINGLLVVAIGAFGAHGLEPYLSAAAQETYQTGVQYHMFHVTGQLAAALLYQRHPQAGYFRWSGYLFILGILLFSGSLYLLSLTGTSALGLVTPFGGVALLAGWSVMIAGLLRVAD